jgi:hypothetical protein
MRLLTICILFEARACSFHTVITDGCELILVIMDRRDLFCAGRVRLLPPTELVQGRPLSVLRVRLRLILPAPAPLRCALTPPALTRRCFLFPIYSIALLVMVEV